MSNNLVLPAIIIASGIAMGLALQGGIYSFNHPSQTPIGFKLNRFTGAMEFCYANECKPVAERETGQLDTSGLTPVPPAGSSN